MAYTIVKSDGTVLTTIPDGTINTTSTSIGLPGRNYPGYGQTLDTNFVHMLESFADSVPPQKPLRGQLWFNTNTSTLCVCPVDNATLATQWYTLTATASGGNTTFGSVVVSANLTANNITANYDANIGNLLTTSYLTVTANANVLNANITSAGIGTLTTNLITTGSTSNLGNIIGSWQLTGAGTQDGNAGVAMYITGGNLLIRGTGGIGILSNNYMLGNGDNLFSAGTAYSNANVQAYLPTYAGNVGNVLSPAVRFYGNTLSTGSDITPGTITGDWTFSVGSKFTVGVGNITTQLNAGIVNASSYIVTATNMFANSGYLQAANVYANTGNVQANNVIVTNTVQAGNLQGIFSNGTSNVRIPAASGNVNISVAGNANVVVVTGTGVNVAGTLNIGTYNANVGNIGGNNAYFANVLTDNLLYANGNPWDLQDPGGSNQAVQFNDNESFGGTNNFLWNNATSALTVTGTITATGTISGGTGSFSLSQSTGNTVGANLVANAYSFRGIANSVAAAGSTQGTAQALAKDINVITSCAPGAGVRLPLAVPGMVLIINNTTTNNLNVYPDTGGVVNNLSVNAPFVHNSGNTSIQYYSISGTQWYTIGATYS